MTIIIMDIIFIGKVKFHILRQCRFTYPGDCLQMSGDVYTGGVYDLCLKAKGKHSSTQSDCLIIIEKGEIFVYQPPHSSYAVKCVSPFGEFIELLTESAPQKYSQTQSNQLYIDKVHDFIDSLAPNMFKDSFGPIFPAELKPMPTLPQILWAFIQAPGLNLEVDYQIYRSQLGTDPEYPLDVEQVERYLLMGRYSIKLLKNGKVIKHPDRTSGIMVIVDTGSDYEFAGII